MDPQKTPGAKSPPWQPGTRLITGVLLITMTAILVYRLRQLLTLVVLALLLAYLLHPIVTRLSRRVGSPRSTAVLIVFLILIVLIAGTTTGLGFVVTQQLTGLVEDLQQLAVVVPAQILALTQQKIDLGPFGEIDLAATNLESLADSLTRTISPLLSQTGNALASLVGATATALGTLVAVFVVSVYLLLDFDKIDDEILAMVPLPYREDFRSLMDQTGQVWQAFLRGQLLLALVIGAATAVVLTALRLRFAFGLGILAGMLEFVPMFGPLISALLAVLVALFQGTNAFGLSPLGFALVVLGAMVIIQQVENNILVPRIIGHSLNLRPLVVLIAVLAGGSLAGVLGVLLAAPAVATLRLWVGYIYRKTVDLDSQAAPVLEPVSGRRRRIPLRALVDRLRHWSRRQIEVIGQDLRAESEKDGGEEGP